MTPSCGSGEACDVEANTGLFECFPPPNTQGAGATCDNDIGPYCMHGLACTTGGCAYFCCGDGDCTTGTCTSLGMLGSVEVKVCQ
jgi:hypothetical protein